MLDNIDQLLRILGILGGLFSALSLLRSTLLTLGVIEFTSEDSGSTRIIGLILNILPGAIALLITVARFFGTDIIAMIGVDPELYADFLQILNEKHYISVFTRLGNYFLYLIIGKNSLPINDLAELNRSRLPGTVDGDWSFNGLPILVTIGYWLGVI